MATPCNTLTYLQWIDMSRPSSYGSFISYIIGTFSFMTEKETSIFTSKYLNGTWMKTRPTDLPFPPNRFISRFPDDLTVKSSLNVSQHLLYWLMSMNNVLFAWVWILYPPRPVLVLSVLSNCVISLPCWFLYKPWSFRNAYITKCCSISLASG